MIKHLPIIVQLYCSKLFPVSCFKCARCAKSFPFFRTFQRNEEQQQKLYFYEAMLQKERILKNTLPSLYTTPLAIGSN